MNQSEFKTLKKRVAVQAATDSFDADESFGNEVLTKKDVTKTKTARKMLGVVDKVKFKRKKAKVRLQSCLQVVVLLDCIILFIYF